MKTAAEVWFAPGRANLMGEHTDYNQGLVLPFAIAQSVTVVAARRDDRMLVLRSRQAPAESAGLACSTALALTGLAGRCVPRRELVEIARRAENDFIGVPSGIMDQSASLLCEAGHALLLDCGTREISQVPFDPAAAGIGLLVIDTRAEHAHAGGDYARRRAECEQAARQLGVPFLGCLTDAADVGGLADPALRGR